MFPEAPAELTIVTHAALAFVLAWTIGYERFYNGRAAGTQVYCLVCTASCALTSATGLAGNWFGTRQLADANSSTQVIASLLTGIGFLGAGIIVKSGASVRGLTTAASIWSSAAIGILVGVHLAVAATGLTAIFIVCMAAVPRLERHLPGKAAIAVRLRYCEGARPQTDRILAFLGERNLVPHSDSLSVTFDGGRFGLELIVSGKALQGRTLNWVVEDLPDIQSIESFTITRTSRT
ncbi:MAG: MgtC/SapB family protein [Steroidobacteraceae bacterium]|jgi:putative Mg2+ transporter-C (MgtC) family protein